MSVLIVGGEHEEISLGVVEEVNDVVGESELDAFDAVGGFGEFLLGDDVVEAVDQMSENQRD